ncbi:MAG TPA: hypothetical protein VJZ68_03910 [Nitrososphaera sp.]|nr:hypothetical protein [Nitrososphaera sp.]
MDECGGENVMFKVAAIVQDNATAYSNTTNVTLYGKWKSYERDLAGADLQ